MTFKKVAKSLKRLADSLRNIGCIFAFQFAKLELTNYTCNSCGGRLAIEDHDADEIFYICCSCGKLHKAHKNQVLGRF